MHCPLGFVYETTASAARFVALQLRSVQQADTLVSGSWLTFARRELMRGRRIGVKRN